MRRSGQRSVAGEVWPLMALMLAMLTVCHVKSVAVAAGGEALDADAATTPALLEAVPNGSVVVEDGFWSPRVQVWREVTVPDSYGKFERDGALVNFDRIRDGQAAGGEHSGLPWFDGLIYEMIRASADFLASEPDPALEARVDAMVERIAAAAAADPNGYLNTYTQIKEPDHRWGLNGGNDNWQHDVYNAGAMVEAAVHYYRATGKTALLGVATRLANHMADVMGPPPRKSVIPGHSLGEEALVKLYTLFRDEPGLKERMPVPVDEGRYLELAQYWIDNRGHHEGRESFGSYGQDHIPVLEQTTIEGHAVRATLMWAGVVAIAREAQREEYLTAARRVWDNLVERRMYVTGGVGAVANIEGFGGDFDLPNTGYLETCGAVGAGFFHQNLALMCAEGRYSDEVERALYNGALVGVSLKGDRYTYENPLASDGSHHRWEWHTCPCCPPMFLKLMAGLPGMIYAQGERDLYVNQFVGSQATVTVAGTEVKLSQTTRYPWEGEVRLSLEPEREVSLALHVRLPEWCESPRLRVNGEEVAIDGDGSPGYAKLDREWKSGDVVELTLPMPVRRVRADERVKANAGRVAIARGPIVYAIEGVDNGGHVSDVVLPPEAELTAEWREDLLGGVMVVRGRATVAGDGAPIELMAVPYYAIANREPSARAVWIAESVAAATAKAEAE